MGDQVFQPEIFSKSLFGIDPCFRKNERSGIAKRKYYLESYRIAATTRKRNAAVAYVHFGPSEVPLPQLELTDKISLENTGSI